MGIAYVIRVILNLPILKAKESLNEHKNRVEFVVIKNESLLFENLVTLFIIPSEPKYN